MGEMRRILAIQLKEKEARKKLLSESEAQRVAQFNQALKQSEAREGDYKRHLREMRAQNKADLETQMKEKAILARERDRAMNNVERKVKETTIEFTGSTLC